MQCIFIQEDSLNQELSDSSLTAGEKRHRVQLLRSWLLYFVTLIHGYFMSRVVHSTHLQLRFTPYNVLHNYCSIDNWM